MAELYKNKYRIESTRLKNWDYASPGAYFVTICTKNREPYFGKIVNGKMELSEMGQIAEKYWREIPVHFSNVHLDEFVVMPDHFHGIIVIVETPKLVETPNLGVSTTNLGVSTTIRTPAKNWKPGTLGVIINQYKRICTIQIKKRGYGFAWQPRFYDRIIRNDGELNRIRQYIADNPMNWGSNGIRLTDEEIAIMEGAVK